MATKPIEVVIVTHNSSRHIAPCLRSVEENGGCATVVDNNSTDDTLKIIREQFPKVKIIPAGGNLGYGKSINIGFAQTSGEFVVLSNPDVVYSSNAIPAMRDYLERHPDVGVIGGQQVYPNGSWQYSYGDLPGIWPGVKDAIGLDSVHNWLRRLCWPYRLDRRIKEVPYVDGAVLVVRRKAFEQLGGFDEDFYFYGDETDLCARLRKAGWRVMFYPFTTIMHVRGADSVQVDRSEKFLRYLVESQARVAGRHLAAARRRPYYRLQMMKYKRLRFSYALATRIGGRRHLPQTERKLWVLGVLERIWREQVRPEGTTNKQVNGNPRISGEHEPGGVLTRH